YHDDMTREHPACLVAYASALDSLATVLLDRGLRADYPTHRIVTGGEKLWGHQRARVEQAFAVPVHERYGSREIGLIAMQLEPQRTLAFEVDWLNLLVEPETDDPESPILVTKLQADAMPMIRYRIGDMARFPAGSRPGHPAFALDEVLGRTLDRLHLPDGRWLHGIGIAHLMKDFPLREFQIRQQPDFALEVFLVPNEGYESAHGAQILEVLAQNLPGLPMALRLVDAVPHSRSNKWRPVHSLVPVPEGTPSRPGPR
ncbi:MAG TPA: hypothetical protein VFV33_13465, partial [Gemmatimonadaceae bacterium]|nr:hypothetical protein [Gemmatimonadaceae bacterium]